MYANLTATLPNAAWADTKSGYVYETDAKLNGAKPGLGGELGVRFHNPSKMLVAGFGVQYQTTSYEASYEDDAYYFKGKGAYSQLHFNLSSGIDVALDPNQKTELTVEGIVAVSKLNVSGDFADVLTYFGDKPDTWDASYGIRLGFLFQKRFTINVAWMSTEYSFIDAAFKVPANQWQIGVGFEIGKY